MSQATARNPVPESTRIRWDVDHKYGWGYVPKVDDELIVHRVTMPSGSQEVHLSRTGSSVMLGDVIDGAELRDWVVKITEVHQGGRELVVVPI